MSPLYRSYSACGPFIFMSQDVGDADDNDNDDGGAARVAEVAVSARIMLTM